jgi:hypothetical protein
MGQTITSPVEMVSYAGELRRAAKQVPALEQAAKIHQSAAELEKAGLAKVGVVGAGVGILLDLLT